MPSPSVTYTLSNGSVADAAQINQNYQDLINALSDGTKDLSISALTAAGNVSFTGSSITLGNASSDDLTVTASLASTINIKTTASYDIGSSSLGLAGIYFGANSQTVRIVGSGSMSATWTLTLPTTAGTNNYALTTNGSGVTSWTAWSTSAWAATTSALGTVYLPASYSSYQTGAGHGSTNTKIRRIETAITNTGSGITYASSATNGSSWTATQAGVYTINYFDLAAAAGPSFGISKNASSLTTNIGSLAASEQVANFSVQVAGTLSTCSATVICAANDVLRPHTSGGSLTDSNADVRFLVCQLFRTA